MKIQPLPNEYILSIAGTASLPDTLNMNEDYRVTVEGDIRSVTKKNNDDGTVNLIYKFKPAKVESVESKGKTMMLKDKSPLSQKLRGRAFVWQTVNESNRDYEWFGNACIRHFDEVMNLLIELDQH